MQVTTKTTAYFDGAELRDLIAEVLRKEGHMPKDAKFDVTFTTESHGDPTPLKEAKNLRIQVSWLPTTDK